MISVGPILGITSMIMIVFAVLYFTSITEGTGTRQDFTDMKTDIDKIKTDFALGDSSIVTNYRAADSLIIQDIEQIKEQIQELQDRPFITSDDPEPDVLSVASDLQLQLFADAGGNIETNIFHRGDIINGRAYNEFTSEPAVIFITDPNGDTTEPIPKGTNQGQFNFIHQISESAIAGGYTLTLQIGEKVQAKNFTVSD